MSVVFTKDKLRASVEASTGGKVTVLYDDKGYPSYMYRVPKFNIEDIDPGLGTGVHPAFVVGGVEKQEIFIGQHLASIAGGRAVSLPGMAPATSVTFDQARDYCKGKGSGWHLMTNWEWAAIALWCMANGYQPRGNTASGKSHEATYEAGTKTDVTDATLTGSGPASWRHDKTFCGIADMVGNVWEWNDGFKLVDGQCFYPGDNNYNLDESSYTASGVYIDSPSSGDGEGVSNLGSPVFANSVSNYAGPQGSDEGFDYNSISNWKDTSVTASASSNLTALKQMLIVPSEVGAGELLSGAKGYFSVRNYGERLAFRGGHWGNGSNAGLFALNLDNPRSISFSAFGFRPAFIL
jgi:hypothetical protein